MNNSIDGPKTWAWLAMASALVMSTGPANADKLVMGVSQTFESGDFGEATTTNIDTTTFKLSYFSGDWRSSLKLPFVSVSGVETIIPGTRGNVRGNNATTSTTSTTVISTRAGFGDAQLSLSRAFLPEHDDDLLIEWTLAAKLATADEDKQLGSGENDYSLALYVDREFGDWLPRLTLGYQLTGDTPTTDYNDILFASIGTDFRVSNSTSVGLTYNQEQATLDGADDVKSLAADFSTDLTRHTRVGLGWQKGLTDSSPDTAWSLFLSTGF